MLLSIIIPVFNESRENIEELHIGIDKICHERKYNYEVVFVDDGSTNSILDFLKSLHFRDKRIKLIAFDKNYGQMNALAAGMYFAKGDVIIIMDADLQYLPEEMPRFIEKISRGHDVVGGKRRKEEIGFFSKILTNFFNIALRVKLADHGCSYSAIKRDVVNRLFCHGFTISLKPLAIMLAKKGIEIDVTYNKRKYGNSHYSFIKYIYYGIKYIYSFLNLRKPCKHTSFPFKIALSMLD